MFYIRSKFSGCFCAVFVCAAEVAYIKQNTEIVVCNARYDFFDSFTVLTEKAVVFNACNNAFFFCIFRNSFASVNKDRKYLLKACVIFYFFGYTPCGIMSHTSCAENFSNVNLAADSFNFCVKIIVFEQICGNYVGNNR